MTNIGNSLIKYHISTQGLGPDAVMNNDYNGNYVAKWKNYQGKE